jgi:hypothetical protein
MFPSISHYSCVGAPIGTNAATLCFCGKTAVGKGLSLLTGSRHESGDRIEQNWKQRGKVQHHWGKLTDDDLGGCRNELAVRIQ